VTIISRAEWGARPAHGGPGPLDPSQVIGLAFHWPAMTKPIRGTANVARALRGWQAYHMDSNGWSDIAYQVAVDQDGNEYELRGLRTTSGANGDGGVNARYGAVLLILAPGEKPSPEMIGTVRRIVARHREFFPKSRLLVGHSDIRAGGTACPGPAVQAALKGRVFEPRSYTRGEAVDHALSDLRKAKGKGERAAAIHTARKALRSIRKWVAR
jgi:hypothetical protein